MKTSVHQTQYRVAPIKLERQHEGSQPFEATLGIEAEGRNPGRVLEDEKHLIFELLA